MLKTITIMLSFFTSLCFFGIYWKNKEIITFVLGLIWFFIAILNFLNKKKVGKYVRSKNKKRS